jgi:hypothetical protein
VLDPDLLSKASKILNESGESGAVKIGEVIEGDRQTMYR